MKENIPRISAGFKPLTVYRDSGIILLFEPIHTSVRWERNIKL